MISVVDDEASVRKALGRLLRASGFDVETFASGTEFLDSLRRQPPHCTILDLHLPGLSGLEVQQRLRQENISVPCIIITGKDEPGLGDRALTSGAAAFLRKPLDEQSLLAAITAAVPDCKSREGSPNKGSDIAWGPSREQTPMNGGKV
jgi:FixJ family two-component response regulator